MAADSPLSPEDRGGRKMGGSGRNRVRFASYDDIVGAGFMKPATRSSSKSTLFEFLYAVDECTASSSTTSTTRLKPGASFRPPKTNVILILLGFSLFGSVVMIFKRFLGRVYALVLMGSSHRFLFVNAESSDMYLLQPIVESATYVGIAPAAYLLMLKHPRNLSNGWLMALISLVGALGCITVSLTQAIYVDDASVLHVVYFMWSAFIISVLVSMSLVVVEDAAPLGFKALFVSFAYACLVSAGGFGVLLRRSAIERGNVILWPKVALIELSVGLGFLFFVLAFVIFRKEARLVVEEESVCPASQLLPQRMTVISTLRVTLLQHKIQRLCYLASLLAGWAGLGLDMWYKNSSVPSVTGDSAKADDPMWYDRGVWGGALGSLLGGFYLWRYERFLPSKKYKAALVQIAAHRTWKGFRGAAKASVAAGLVLLCRTICLGIEGYDRSFIDQMVSVTFCCCWRFYQVCMFVSVLCCAPRPLRGLACCLTIGGPFVLRLPREFLLYFCHYAPSLSMRLVFVLPFLLLAPCLLWKAASRSRNWFWAENRRRAGLESSRTTSLRRQGSLPAEYTQHVSVSERDCFSSES